MSGPARPDAPGAASPHSSIADTSVAGTGAAADTAPIGGGAGASGATPRIAAVDGLRAVALLLVFGYHTWEFAGRPELGPLSRLLAANTRPDLFVVLAGFSLYLPFALQPARLQTFSVRAFLVRRMRRITPPYYVAIAVAIALPLALKVPYRLMGLVPDATVLPAWADVLAHMTYTHLFFADYWSSINGSLWTMSLEVQLYLVFPFVVILLDRYRLRAAAGLVGVAFGYRIVAELVTTDDGVADFLTSASGPGKLLLLLSGIASAHVAVRGTRLPRRRLGILGLGGTCAYLLATETSPSALDLLPWREVWLSIAFGSLSLVAVRSSRLSRLLSWRPLATLGLMSYSAFLLHQPLMWYASEFGRRALGLPDGVALLALQWTAGLAVTLAAARLMFILVEHPSICWAKAKRVY